MWGHSMWLDKSSGCVVLWIFLMISKHNIVVVNIVTTVSVFELVANSNMLHNIVA